MRRVLALKPTNCIEMRNRIGENMAHGAFLLRPMRQAIRRGGLSREGR